MSETMTCEASGQRSSLRRGREAHRGAQPKHGREIKNEEGPKNPSTLPSKSHPLEHEHDEDHGADDQSEELDGTCQPVRVRGEGQTHG